ncbi:hypothetical protein JTB14_016334 [Gonioctena quinquepunctata]|nr:hypothetical protein JTB14_016334 [Gonioctena quinquepunctata]
MLCCGASLGMAIIAFLIPLHPVTKTILMTTATAFFFITILDVIAFFVKQQMAHKHWRMMCVAAFSTFSLCAGFTMFLTRKTSAMLLLIACGVNILTAVVFLVDYILMTWLYWGVGSRITPADDKAISACFLFEVNEYECPAMKKTKCKYSTTVKPVSLSHGGTFHMSKETAPLTSFGSSMQPECLGRCVQCNAPIQQARGASSSMVHECAGSCEQCNQSTSTAKDGSMKPMIIYNVPRGVNKKLCPNRRVIIIMNSCLQATKCNLQFYS